MHPRDRGIKGKVQEKSKGIKGYGDKKRVCPERKD